MEEINYVPFYNISLGSTIDTLFVLCFIQPLFFNSFFQLLTLLALYVCINLRRVNQTSVLSDTTGHSIFLYTQQSMHVLLQ
jgi:hypothetical protein